MTDNPTINSNTSFEQTTPVKKHWLKKVLQWAFLVVVSLYIAIWVFSPLAVSYFASNFLSEEFRLQLSDKSSIRFNPFTSHLSINDLVISKDQQQVFGVDNLELEIRLHRVLIDEIYISEFSVDGLHLLTSQVSTGWEVAGLVLPMDKSRVTDNSVSIAQSDSKVAGAEAKTEQAQTEPKKESLKQEETTTLWTVIAPKINFSNHRFELKHNQNQHQFEINELALERVTLSSVEQAFDLKLQALVDGGSLLVTQSLSLKQQLGDGQFSVALDGYDLNRLLPYLGDEFKQLEGQLGFSSQLDMNLKEEGVELSLPDTQLVANQIKMDAEFGMIDVKQQTLQMDEVKLTVHSKTEKGTSTNIDPETEPKNDTGTPEVSLSVGRVAVLSDSLSATTSELSAQNGGIEFSLNTLEAEVSNGNQVQAKINQIELSSRELGFKQPSLDFINQSVTIISNNISYSNSRLEIDEVLVDNLKAQLSLLKLQASVSGKEVNTPQGESGQASSSQSDEAKVAENEVESSNQNIETPTKNIEQTPQEKPFPFLLKRFAVTNFQQFTFIDNNVVPAYQREVFLDEVYVNDIDSQKPSAESPFKIKGRSDQYTAFDFAGYLRPFEPQLNLKLSGELNEVSLPPASSYIESLLGFQFETGELDTGIELEAVNGELKGNTAIKIRGLALASAENYDQSVVQEQTAVPLNVALGMLKDSDDNVELDIPMMGDVNSPTFGMGSFVTLVTKRAIQSAAKEYLIKTFIPYAEILSVTMSAGEFIFKTRFEDMPYRPKQIEIDSNQENYFEQFVTLMKDKTSTSVKVCSTATAAELDEPLVDEELQQAQATQLKDLSLKRMNHFKQRAVEQGVESSRILLCAPKVDITEGAEPKITISV
jgi:hypothetical protein